jgi:hypothetical protein
MLINKGYSTGDIVSFKISNGDEIVAKIVEERTDAFVVSKPCTIIPSERGLGLMQSLFSAEVNTDMTLQKIHVILHAPSVKDLQNHYIRTTTGIETVTDLGR